MSGQIECEACNGSGKYAVYRIGSEQIVGSCGHCQGTGLLDVCEDCGGTGGTIYHDSTGMERSGWCGTCDGDGVIYHDDPITPIPPPTIECENLGIF